MKVKQSVLVLLSIALLVLGGCADVLVTDAECAGGDVLPRSASGAKAVLHSAEGSAHAVTWYGPKGQATWNYMFNAREYADGTFGGHFTQIQKYTDIWENHPILYLNVDDSDPLSRRALIVTYFELPEWFMGGGMAYLAYLVTDNGEGAKASPDTFSGGLPLQVSNPAMAPHIERLLHGTPDDFGGVIEELGWGSESGFTIVVEAGNVQVR